MAMRGLRRTLSKIELDHFTKKEEGSTAHVGKEMVMLEPKIVESFHSLRYLSLADNLLTDLPDELSQLQFLKKLNLKNNRFQEFPKCLLKLTNLRGLSIKGNKLREVPSEISQMTSLQMMNFSNNHLVHLPVSLLDMNIMKLRINDNPLIFPSSKSVKQGLSAVFEEMKRYKRMSDLPAIQCVDFEKTLDLPFEIDAKRWHLKVSMGQSLLKGRRPYMEDRVVIHELDPFPTSLPGSRVVYVGMFDGHGGFFAADLCVEHFHVIIENTWRSILKEAVGLDLDKEVSKRSTEGGIKTIATEVSPPSSPSVPDGPDSPRSHSPRSSASVSSSSSSSTSPATERKRGWTVGQRSPVISREQAPRSPKAFFSSRKGPSDSLSSSPNDRPTLSKLHTLSYSSSSIDGLLQTTPDSPETATSSSSSSPSESPSFGPSSPALRSSDPNSRMPMMSLPSPTLARRQKSPRKKDADADSIQTQEDVEDDGDEEFEIDYSDAESDLKSQSTSIPDQAPLWDSLLRKSDSDTSSSSSQSSSTSSSSSSVQSETKPISNSEVPPPSSTPLSTFTNFESEMAKSLKLHNGLTNREICLRLLPEALFRSFAEMDRFIIEKSHETKTETGTTVLIGLLVDNLFVFANLGDTRAVMSYEFEDVTYARQITVDHKPNSLTEKIRIRALGGRVTTKDKIVYRVNGELAVSRSLGDYTLKPFVSNVPDIKPISLNPRHKAVIMATDGVWDVLSNYDTVDIDDAEKTAQASADKITSHSFKQNSFDNISSLVLRFHWDYT